MKSDQELDDAISVEVMLKKLNASGKLYGYAALYHDGRTWVICDLGSNHVIIGKSNSLRCLMRIALDKLVLREKSTERPSSVST